MGTGSQKRGSRYSAYKAGDPLYTDVGATQQAPQAPANQSGYYSSPTAFDPNNPFSQPLQAPPGTPAARAASNFAGPAAPQGPPSIIHMGSTDVASNSPMLSILRGLAHNPPGVPKPRGGGGGTTTQQDQLNAFFNSMYPDQTGQIKANYAKQEAAINAQYDQQLGRLNNEAGAATKGIQAEGQNLQASLKAIGADANAQLAASNTAIGTAYSKALSAVNNNYKPLAADLKAQGATGAGLKAEAAAGRANLNEAQATDSALGQRYQQMLSQEINNRQATGSTVTTADAGQIASILSQARDTTSNDRLQAVAKVEANLAGDLVQANNQRASAKYSLFLSALKSGGTLGQAGAATLSPTTILKNQQSYVKDGTVNWSPAFDSALKSSDPQIKMLAANFRQQIQFAKDPLSEATHAFSIWQASPQAKQYPEVTIMLMKAAGLAETATARRAADKLGIPGIK